MAFSQDGWMDPLCLEVRCTGMPVGGRADNRVGLVPPPEEHLIGHCVVENDGLDTLSLVSSCKAPFMLLE